MYEFLKIIVAGHSLETDQAYEAFNRVMSGDATETQIGALLTGLQTRPGGPTVDEITGAARAMRDHVTALNVPNNYQVIDTCGTGGDHSGTFNISTTAALIAAGAGARVVKHGNRSVTSQSGSSQVLEHLGVNLAATAESQLLCLEQARLCFCFGPAHHPAMKHAAGPRKELGFRTIFNLVGPLTNPAGAKRQVLGVYSDELTEMIAKVLGRLGSVHAMVVHGKTLAAPDVTQGGMGLDELTTTGPTRITVLKDGQIETSQLHPADLGLTAASIEELRIEGVEASADVIRRVLNGEQGPARDIALLNAAAALVVADLAADLVQGIQLAAEAVDDGRAKQSLDQLIAITNQ